jgi:Fe-S-cluster containining protein
MAMLLVILFWQSFLCSVALAQTLSLAELPYRNPRPLDTLLARDDPAFQLAIQQDWQRIERTLAMFVPLRAKITSSSLFFDTARQRCTQQQKPAACRLYMDFLSFQMKQKVKVPMKSRVRPPVLLRPAQLPYRHNAVLNALTELDAPTLQSALAAHWDWIHEVIERFLPDHYALYPMSKVFGGIRDTCQNAHTEIACRLHLSDIDSIIDNNRQQIPTLFRSLEQIPYRDPAPLYALLQLSESEWRSHTNPVQLDALLNRYIGWSVAIVGDMDFARARLDCQAVMPGDYVRCRDYLVRLSGLMRNK